MANIPVTVEQVDSQYHFLGEFCEIKIVFLDNANAPVPVINPEITFQKKQEEDKYELVTITPLTPLSPSGAKEGEYRTTFFSDNLEVGRYKVIFKGYYPDTSKVENLIEREVEFETFEINGFQSLIEMLRVQLSDHRPELYLIDDPDSFRWNDGDLYSAIKSAMDFWNQTVPVSVGNSIINKDNILNFPIIGSVMLLAEYFGLVQKYNLETVNTITYSDDMTFTIDRSQRLMTRIQQIQQWMENSLINSKKDYVLRYSAKVRGIKSTRIPMRALKNLSMTPAFSFLSSGM